jgi:hypothetical protein
MSEKKRTRARRPAEEILKRAADADDTAPDTPISGASKATTPPRPRKRAALPPGARGRRPV